MISMTLFTLTYVTATTCVGDRWTTGESALHRRCSRRASGGDQWYGHVDLVRLSGFLAVLFTGHSAGTPQCLLMLEYLFILHSLMYSLYTHSLTYALTHSRAGVRSRQHSCQDSLCVDHHHSECCTGGHTDAGGDGTGWVPLLPGSHSGQYIRYQ